MKTSKITTALFTILITTLLVTGCSSKKTKDDVNKEAQEIAYKAERERLERTDEIAPGFTLLIRHSADDEINGKYQVEFGGSLKLPYKVEVVAAGSTPAELKNKILKAYSGFYKGTHSVTVEIIKREYIIEVRGLVQKPGKYVVSSDTSVEEVITLAGGFPTSQGEGGRTTNQKAEFLRVVRPNFKEKKPAQVVWLPLSEYFVKYENDASFLWHGGEQLFFQLQGDGDAIKKRSASTVKIIGEVRTPGEFPIIKNGDIQTYLASAGGPMSSADLENIVIIHARGGRDTVDATGHDIVEDLEGGDTILVKSIQTKPNFLEKTLPLILAITSIVTSVYLLLFVL